MGVTSTTWFIAVVASVGLVVGGALIILAVCCCMRRRRRPNKTAPLPALQVLYQERRAVDADSTLRMNVKCDVTIAGLIVLHLIASMPGRDGDGGGAGG